MPAENSVAKLQSQIALWEVRLSFKFADVVSY